MNQSPHNGTAESSSDPRFSRALSYLYDRINYERTGAAEGRYRFRLQRITELLKQLGLADYLYAAGSSPGVPLVHLAGTKGKGSTATMVAAVLSAAGKRTGLYTSPHLHDLEERFRIDGQPCTPDQLISCIDHVRPSVAIVERQYGPISFFELTTALALAHFDRSECDLVVLEVGLGGRLDSTNVCAPSVSAITSIGLDHQQVLGDTLAGIAAEKAGIIKPGVPVISGVDDGVAAEVIADRAGKCGSELFQLGTDFDCQSQPAAEWGCEVTYRGRRAPLRSSTQATLAMEGQHQGRNAAIAIAIIDLLRSQGIPISDDAIDAGLRQLQCIGRIERFMLPDDNVAIVDSAHNSDSIECLCETLRQRCANRPVAIVFGTSVDKQVEPMLNALSTVADHLFLTRFWGNPRYRPTQDLLSLLPDSDHATAVVVEDPVAACEAALRQITPGGAVVVCGSFFLAAETRRWFQRLEADYRE